MLQQSDPSMVKEVDGVVLISSWTGATASEKQALQNNVINGTFNNMGAQDIKQNNHMFCVFTTSCLSSALNNYRKGLRDQRRTKALMAQAGGGGNGLRAYQAADLADMIEDMLETHEDAPDEYVEDDDVTEISQRLTRAQLFDSDSSIAGYQSVASRGSVRFADGTAPPAGSNGILKKGGGTIKTSGGELVPIHCCSSPIHVLLTLFSS